MSLTDREIDRYTETSPVSQWQETLRLAGTGIGLIVIIVGLYYAIRVFGAIYSGVTSPEGAQPMIEQWSERMGGDNLAVLHEGQEVRLAPVMAVIVLGVGAFILAHIALGVMITGAKIVSWTATDRQAVKRIIMQALGRSGGNQ